MPVASSVWVWVLGERKADAVLRLHDMRRMAIECKVTLKLTGGPRLAEGRPVERPVRHRLVEAH